MIAEAETLLATTVLPERRAERVRELLGVSVKLADSLLEEPPAAALGAKGGKKTAERGSEYNAQTASMRKKGVGDRPKKKSE